MSEYTERIYDDKGEFLFAIPAELGDEITLWHKIVITHNSAKNKIILAEECSINRNCFVQPMNEQRNALEHIVRGKAHELGIKPRDSSTYLVDNLKKALAHEYRAYFDAADILVNELLGQIGKILEPYTPLQKKEQMPDWEDMAYEFKKVRTDITNIRGDKDIVHNEGV